MSKDEHTYADYLSWKPYCFQTLSHVLPQIDQISTHIFEYSRYNYTNLIDQNYYINMTRVLYSPF